MASPINSWHIPKIDEVPDQTYERVIAAVTSVAERRAARAVERSALTHWLQQEAGGLAHVDGRDERLLRAEISKLGFTVDAFDAIVRAAHVARVHAAARAFETGEIPLPKAHGIPPIVHPQVWTPPYGGSMTYTSTPDETNFIAGDPTRLPAQPNSQSAIFDPATGQVGCNLVQDHLPGAFSFSSGSCNITQACLVGVWAKAWSPQQIVWASATLETGALAGLGNRHAFGSGAANLSNWMVIEAYTGNEAPGHPDSSFYQMPITFQPQSIDGHFELDVPAQTAHPAATLHVPHNTWFWLMVGNAETLTASVSHTDLTVSADFTWRIDSISAYL